jgi:hypothetical protein
MIDKMNNLRKFTVAMRAHCVGLALRPKTKGGK